MTLNDRERFVLHAMSLMVVDVMIKKFNDKTIDFENIQKLTPSMMIDAMNKIRDFRCRNLSKLDVSNLYEDINEEMMLGQDNGLNIDDRYL